MPSEALLKFKYSSYCDIHIDVCVLENLFSKFFQLKKSIAYEKYGVGIDPLKTKRT
jgi:hypothetical protein